MRILYAFYEQQLVGRLSQDEDLVFHFEYDEAWRKNPKAFALSLALPLQEASFGNRLSLSFFENLLPEGTIKDAIERHHNISGVMEFLDKYGRDCAGAIVLSSQPGGIPNLDPNQMIELDMTQVYEAVEAKESVADAISSMNPGYLSLAGAQDKFAAIYKEGRFFLPAQGGATTHIIKPPIQHSGIKESVYNEYYCMELARAVGLLVPACFVLPGRHPLFVIERYDRSQGNDGLTHRIHQQDFCQAQGFTSEQKYEDKGGPTIKQDYELILKHFPAKKRLRSLTNFLDWVAFNLLIGNNDSHSKNISLLLQPEGLTLAPFYDLLCSAIYPRLQREFSFSIGGQSDFTKISKRNTEVLENDLGLKAGTFGRHILTLAAKIEKEQTSVAKRVQREHPKAKIPTRISTLISDRIKSLQLQGIK
jgi:serine/threonine-protein kinase HipA